MGHPRFCRRGSERRGLIVGEGELSGYPEDDFRLFTGFEIEVFGLWEDRVLNAGFGICGRLGKGYIAGVGVLSV